MKILWRIFNEESDEGYFLEVEAQYQEKLHELRNGFPFLPERKKIKEIKKLVTNLFDKNEYAI